MTMKNLSIDKTIKSVHPEKWTNSHLHSIVVDEVLNLTYPNFQNLFPFKKEELYRVIFNYFFNDDDAMFYEIENFSNLITACNLKGLKIIIQKNGLTSFDTFDKHLISEKSKSFESLNQALTTREVLSDLEKDKILGGLKEKEFSPIPLDFYFQLRTA